MIGFALFWKVLIDYPSAKSRFGLATVWFTSVQLVQLSWFISHPYVYIYPFYFLLSLWLGLEFGLVALFIRPQIVKSIPNLLGIASLWVIFEWSRMHVLSGLSWNPVGLALSSNLYSLQFASVLGVLGLSFWVIWVNLLGLRAYLNRKLTSFFLWVVAILIPYGYGAIQIGLHESNIGQETIRTLLVQTAFAPEECDIPREKPKLDPINEVIGEWRQILNIVKRFHGEPIDLVVLPEFVVPFGTYSFVFPLSGIVKIFYEELGSDSLDTFPPMQYPFSEVFEDRGITQTYVNNAFLVQAIANYFRAGVVVGLEDAEMVGGEREYYSAALFFTPKTQYEDPDKFEFPSRYEKRVLVPLGEYIPFEFCRNLAARYGVSGSFTCGTGPKVIDFRGVRFSPSICYEETFGDIMRENREAGSELLVNLTSDVWYPNSRLMKQHFDHARLRTVENGFPLVRACNTGITGAFDSLGRIVAVLGGEHPEAVEWVPDALLVKVPTYTYKTFYTWGGDKFLITMCLCFIFLSIAIFKKFPPKNS